MSDIDIALSLDFARTRAEEAVRLLESLRAEYALARFEFTRKVRIAPLELPHSHPVLTLNTRWTQDPDRFLAMYLHEQIHWYLTDHRPDQTKDAIARLRELYPSAPTAEAEGAMDDMSVILHLLVNWLEQSVLRDIVGHERALATVSPPPVYPWCYRTVLEDWAELEAVFSDLGLAPIPDASEQNAG